MNYVTWQLTTKEVEKIEVVWNGFLKKMVKGGYRRQKDERAEENLDDDKQDWRFKLTNADLHRIAKTQPIKSFCLQQQLKYLAHVCRMDNGDMRKQILFDERSSSWARLERLLGIDAPQIRRMMMNRTNFQCLLNAIDTP
jgi:hypothetical protein